MNDQLSFILKNRIFILLLGFGFFFLLENCLFKRESIFISGLNENDLKDIQYSFEESEDTSLPSDAGDLMNILQRIEAMNNATEPSDAIDDALKAFESQVVEESSFDADIPVNN